MRRQICWIERLDDNVKREVRVSFPGQDKIKWQFKRSDRAEWDYDSAPSSEEWSGLLERAEKYYTRRRVPHEVVELIRARCIRPQDADK
jgi:hypothetical protein